MEKENNKIIEKDKKEFFTEDRLEIFVAIFLGITALLTAWATWIGSLHGGNQSTNYTKSNNLAAEGNSEYNSALQTYLSDLMAWNSIVNYEFEEEIANLNGRTAEAELIGIKLQKFIDENCTDKFVEAMNWANSQEQDVSPFDKEGLVDSYFEESNKLLDESKELLEQGQKDNANGDAYGLVTVIYSLALFLLGIITVFKKLPNRKIVFIFSVVAILLATIYMITIPMPTGFNFLSFFKH